MFAKILSCGLLGIDGFIITVEVDLSNGLPAFEIVGLGDAAVRESKERVRAAIKNSGYEFPVRKITVNLAPAGLKKEGSSFDLPIAVGILSASGQISKAVSGHVLIVGELGLDGEVKSVDGMLSIGICAADSFIDSFIDSSSDIPILLIPAVNALEASVVKRVIVLPAKNLKQVVEHLNNEMQIEVWPQYSECSEYADKIITGNSGANGANGANYANDCNVEIVDNSSNICIAYNSSDANSTSNSNIISNANSSNKTNKVNKDNNVNKTNNVNNVGKYPDNDFIFIKGQQEVKRALEIAACGGHNCLMIGSPGSGKTLLAKSLPGILPPMGYEEAVEVTRIYSSTGLLPSGVALMKTRPFRNPHHTITKAGLAGGGLYPTPGEISLAHNGVLFLDEMAEFRPEVLEVLRQPLEDGYVNISRLNAAIRYPARTTLICAVNPCKCGKLLDKQGHCSCTGSQVASYLGRISGPLLDRIDIHMEVKPVKFSDLCGSEKSFKYSACEDSATIRRRVEKVRGLQVDRYKNDGIYCNSQLSRSLLEKHCLLDTKCKGILESAFQKLNLSARGYTRIIAVARTIADMENSSSISPVHIAEAVQYRSLERLLNRFRSQG